jgi:hypothetical protein
MHYLESSFRTALQNKGYRTPLQILFVNQKENQKTFSVCRDGYNLAKDLYNLGLHGITRYKDHERFFVVIEFCSEPSV